MHSRDHAEQRPRLVADDLYNRNFEAGVSLVFVTHDLPVVAQVCQHLSVMYGGQVIESGDVGQILTEPRHPYTAGLVRSVPDFDEVQESLVPIPGSPPSLINPPGGCRFRPRCGYAADDCATGDIPLIALPGGALPAGCRFRSRCPIAQPRCETDDPALTAAPANPSHQAACHYAFTPVGSPDLV